MMILDWLKKKLMPLRGTLRGTVLAPYRFACFGINDFGGRNDLAGCVNDATDWREFAVRELGFTREQTRMLADREATRGAILESWKWAIDGIKPGHLVLLQGSSHGVQIPDRNSDEDDRLDEAFCTYGFNWAPNTMITDDEICAMFSHVPDGALVVIIADCCHSGTMNRSPLEDVRPRRIVPRDNDFDQYRAAHAQIRAIGDCARGDSDPRNLVVLAACKPREFAYDASFGGRARGAFTHATLRTLTQHGVGDITYRKLIDRVGKSIGYPQNPQLSCAPGLESLVAFKHGR